MINCDPHITNNKRQQYLKFSIEIDC